MLVVHPISADQSRYYMEQPALSRWTGAGSKDLGLQGPVDETSLRAVLAGRDPGGDLLLRRISSNRRSGFDLILASPKSVSLLAALAPEVDQARFQRAHDQAVESALGYLERNATWTRRGADNAHMATSGLVAAAFPHANSASGDPHQHTHVVVANLVHGEDGQWSSLDSRSLYRHARAAGAVYQSSLRHHLAEQGLRFDWTVNRNGLGDVVGVPRAAIDAASTRRRQVAEEIESGLAGRIGRATAGARTRRGSGLNAESTGAGGAADATGRASGTTKTAPWPQRVAAAGLDQDTTQRLLAGAANRRALPSPGMPPGLPGARGANGALENIALEHLLSQTHSTFRRADVVQAAATLAVAGASVASLESRVDDFLKTALSAGSDTWTTAHLRRMEDGIIAAARSTPARSVGLASPRAPASPEGLTTPTAGRPVTLATPNGSGPSVGLAGPGAPSPDQLSEAVLRLTEGGAPVDLVRGNLISQAQVLDAARTVWEASGHRVALVSPTERGQARWRALAGLERLPPPPGHATVLIVDNADRWTTADLHHVVADAGARQAKVVLVDGGTKPARRQAESPAMQTLRATLPAIDLGPPAQLEPSRTPGPTVAAGRDGAVIVAPSSQVAADRLVQDWHQRRVAGGTPRMVALGPEEAEHLNTLARAVRTRAGELSGPTVVIGGRPFQAGDEVAALKRHVALGSVPGGTQGRVTAVDPERKQATIEWHGREQPHTVTAKAAPLTHGYATTPPYLRSGHDGPILSLGHVESVAPRLHPDRVYEMVPPTPPLPDRTNPVARLLSELPSGRPPPALADASKSLAALTTERDRLAEHLLANAPADPRPELRRVNEERDWLTASPYRGANQPALAALDQRAHALSAAAAGRGHWLAAQRGQLEQWDDLSHAIAWREAALGRGAEIRPTVAVQTQLGLPPKEAQRGVAWRQAAQAIESHRDRWALPDRPLELNDKVQPGHDVARRADELRVLATTRQLQRDRGRDRDHALSL